jgi:hypothetical protein
MRYIIFYLISILIASPSLVTAQTLLFNNKIWSGENYAAFTSLVFYNGCFYCAFRNANKHADVTGEDCGVIKIIKSKNGDEWESFLSFSEEKFDLRDPQLSITPEKKLLLIANKVHYKEGKANYRQTCSVFIDDSTKQLTLKPIGFYPNLDRNWLWNIEWIDGNAYGFIYSPYFAFTKSQDGIHYRIIERINLSDSPSEASLIKWKNKYVAVVRRNTNSLIGIYNKNKWEWFDSQHRVACPKLIKIKGNLYVVGRHYGDKKQTAIFRIDMKRHILKYVFGIPCKTDCGYPGLVYKDDVLYITYYSGDGKKSDINLAKVKL